MCGVDRWIRDRCQASVHPLRGKQRGGPNKCLTYPEYLYKLSPIGHRCDMRKFRIRLPPLAGGAIWHCWR